MPRVPVAGRFSAYWCQNDIENTYPMTASNLPARPRISDMNSAFIIGSALTFLALCALFWGFTADDAYIVGRYAKNAAAGHGLVYNLGEYVTALTSPLHGLLETGLALLGLDPVTSYRLIAPFVVLAGWFVALRQTGIQGQALVVFTVVGLLSPFLALWTVGGLETPLLACFTTLLVSKLIVVNRAGVVSGRDFAILGLLAGLMFLTRFDSVLVSVPVLLAVLITQYRRPVIWAGAAFSLALAVSWLVFSWAYYGDIFPTSYYVKLAVGGRPPIDSLSALLNFVVLSGLLVLVFFVRSGDVEKRTPLSKAILRGAAISAVLLLLYASRSSGQHMMFGYRLFMPYLMAAGLVLSLSLRKERPMLTAGLVGGQATMIGIVTFWGVNPAPLARLPLLDRAYAEYEFITPKTYGLFMDMLKADAQDIAAHWQETGRDVQPRIYLRTGGTGYWLPEFYVFEALVSYRHGCGVQTEGSILGAHYMQQLGFSKMGTYVEDRGHARDDVAHDAPLMFSTTLEWMGPQVTGYLYGPEPTPLELSTTIGGGCSKSQ
ncbi:4-amino-4-deoxy-L-arabinose transferase [Litoreibacter ascidiaceicola]|uniref:4-amino-4-deoxy-L-arabinose transferase n=2 Tax=Litoreibacter ascidiaceicola TaxID=1486859 RepID=A0A1M4TXW7_9RHOB|nr:4-amino-4-deoxy-L-arabinose transferase [Litoreibacter ascidiaceicola]